MNAEYDALMIGLGTADRAATYDLNRHDTKGGNEKRLEEMG